MPYKDIEHNRIYERGYWSGFIYGIKLHLGSKCSKCGSNQKLEVHHKNNLNRRLRRWKDYKDLSKLILLCSECHKEI